MIKRDGSCISVSLDGQIACDQGGHFEYCHGILHDLTDLRQCQHAKRQAQVEAETKIRNRVLETFLKVPDDRVYGHILNIILDVASSTYGTFGYFNEEGAFVVPYMTGEIYWEQCEIPDKEIVFQRGTFGGIWGQAIEEKRTLYANEGPFNTPEGHIVIYNTMATPIMYHGEVISAIHLANKPAGYDDEDVRTLDAIAQMIAPVLNARLQRDRQEAERKKIEAALRREEERFHSLLDQAADAIFVHDFNGRFLEVNYQACASLGYTRDELMTLSVDDVDPDIPFRRDKQRFWSNLPATFEARHRRKDGELVPVEIRLRTIDYAESKAVLALARDISDRKRTEETLRESEAKYATVFQEALAPIMVVDEDGHYLTANKAALDFFECSMEDLMRKSAWDRPPPERYQNQEGEQSLLVIRRTLETDYLVNARIKTLLLNVVPVEVSGSIVFYAIGHDITDRKMAEDRLKASLKEKEVLLREIHHRVKNNLAVISSLLDFQSDHARDEIHKGMFDECQARIRSMALAHELVYQSENLAELRVGEYFRNLIDHLIVSMSPLGKAIEVRLDIDDVFLALDRAVPLGFLVTELFSNCLKHAFPGNRAGEVTVSVRPNVRGELELVVKDNGVGMAEDIDLSNPQTLGMDLVETFVTKLRGEMEITRHDGTEIRIKLGGDEYRKGK